MPEDVKKLVDVNSLIDTTSTNMVDVSSLIEVEPEENVAPIGTQVQASKDGDVSVNTIIPTTPPAPKQFFSNLPDPVEKLKGGIVVKSPKIDHMAMPDDSKKMAARAASRKQDYEFSNQLLNTISDDKDGYVYELKAHNQSALKDFKGAKENLLQAANLNPNNDRIYHSLAIAAYNDKDRKLASEAAQKYISSVGGVANGDIQKAKNLADAYAIQGDETKSDHWSKNAQQLDEARIKENTANTLKSLPDYLLHESFFGRLITGGASSIQQGINTLESAITGKEAVISGGEKKMKDLSPFERLVTGFMGLWEVGMGAGMYIPASEGISAINATSKLGKAAKATAGFMFPSMAEFNAALQAGQEILPNDIYKWVAQPMSTIISETGKSPEDLSKLEQLGVQLGDMAGLVLASKVAHVAAGKMPAMDLGSVADYILNAKSAYEKLKNKEPLTPEEAKTVYDAVDEMTPEQAAEVDKMLSIYQKNKETENSVKQYQEEAKEPTYSVNGELVPSPKDAVEKINKLKEEGKAPEEIEVVVTNDEAGKKEIELLSNTPKAEGVSSAEVKPEIPTQDGKEEKGRQVLDENGNREGEIPPNSPDLSSEAEFPRWALENSDNPEDLYIAYKQEKANAPSEGLTPWQEALLEYGKFTHESFVRFGDRNKKLADNGTFNKAWLLPKGSKKTSRTVDEFVRLHQEHNPTLTTDKVVEFMQDHPGGYVRKTTDRMDQLAAKYKTLTGQSILKHEAFKAAQAEKLAPEKEAGAVDLPKRLEDLIKDEGITEENLSNFKDSWLLDKGDYELFEKYFEYERGKKTNREPNLGSEVRGNDEAPSAGVESERGGEGVPESDYRKGASTDQYNEDIINRTAKLGELKPVEFPELVSIAKELINYVGTKNLGKNLKGVFRYKEGVPESEKILLNPDLFKEGNEIQLSRVLAHELGHLADYLPDKTLKRGNILGRIASLQKFRGKYISYKKGSAPPLSDADIARLTEEAKKIASNITIEREIEEEITRTTGIEPQDILDVWNTVTGSSNTKLTDYIKTLSTAQKKSIVKEAMKGKVADELKQFVTTIKEKTGRKYTITELVAGDWKKTLKELITKEIEKRRLWDKDKIYHELYAMSKEWRPFDEATASESHLKYRKSGEEVYADAVSAMLTNPGYVQEKAPNFFVAFNNYLGEKGDFAEAWLDVQDLLHDPMAVNEKRLNDMYAGFDLAAEKVREVINAPKQKEVMSGWDKFLKGFVSDIIPVTKRVSSTQTVGKMSKRQAVQNDLELLKFTNNQAYIYTRRNVEEVFKPLELIGVSQNEFGALLVTTRNLADRLEKANPGGWQGDINKTISDYVKTKFTPEQSVVVEQILKKFHDLAFAEMEKLNAAGRFSKEEWEKIEKNKDAYATYWVVDYIDKVYIGAGLKAVTGNLAKAIANPLLATPLKMLSVIQLTERQKAVNSLIRTLSEEPDFQGEWSEARRVGRKGEYAFKGEDGKDHIKYYKDGVYSAINVDPYIADLFNKASSENLDALTKIFAAFSSGFKPLVTKWNPGFAFVSNILRDARRSMANIYAIANQDASVGKKLQDLLVIPATMLKNYPKSIYEASKLLRGKLNELHAEMLRTGAFDVQSGILNNYDSRQSEIESVLFSKKGIGNYKLSWLERNRERSKILDFAAFMIDGYELAGASFELGSKINAFSTLKKRGFTAEEAGFYTRNYAGTPNYKERGYNRSGLDTRVTNNWLPFSNVIIQGLRTDLEVATSPKTASGFAMYHALWTVAPAVLTGLAAAGVFGDDLKRAYRNISRYYKDNFNTIPIGQSEDGKVRFLTIPTDEMSRIINAAVFEIVSNTADKTGKFTLGDLRAVTQVGAGFTPTISPLINIVGAWMQFAVFDQNPYDKFYGKSVVPELKYTAGGWTATKPMVDWTLRTAGLGTVVDIYSYDKATQTTAEYTTKAIPGLNRIVRTSSKGMEEYLAEVGGAADSERAKGLIAQNNIINKYAQEFNENPEADAADYYYKAEEEIEKEFGYQDKEARDNIKSKFKVASIKGAKSPLTTVVRAFIDSKNTDRKIAVLKGYIDVTGGAEAAELIDYLRSNNLITNEFWHQVPEEVKEEYYNFIGR